MTAYSGLKTRIDRLANTAKVYGDVPYMGFISQTDDEFILDIRFTRKGTHDRSEECRFKTFNKLIEFIEGIKNKGKNPLVLFENEELLQ